MKLTLKNQPEEGQRLDAEFQKFAEEQELAMPVVLSVGLALEEIFTNIISYGYSDQQEHLIEASIALKDGKLTVELRDDGVPFDPTLHPTPNLDLPLDEKPIGGLGIHMTRKSLDEMRYKREGNCNVLTLVKLVK